MKINVMGRNIEVHTGMANYHTKLYNEPVDEELLKVYLTAHCDGRIEDYIKTASDAELTEVIQAGLKHEELSCPADSYDKYMPKNTCT